MSVTPGEVVQALEEAVLKLVDETFIRKAWFRFSDQTPLPDGTDDVADLAFRAWYATALDHVGRLLETAKTGLEGSK